MKKSFRLVICIIALFAIMLNYATANSPFIPTDNLSLDNLAFIKELKEAYQELIDNQEYAHSMAECARALGYPEDCDIIATAKEEWHSAQDERLLNAETQHYWEEKYKEYPYATYIWLFLTSELKYSDYVAAGLLGNMMVEVGGCTLNIQYWLYSYDNAYYYGICQWNKDDYPDVRGKNLIEQLNYLVETIEYELNTFGFAYARNYKYANFLELESTDETALMFAKCYERCAASTYSYRQKCATIAYNYFVN